MTNSTTIKSAAPSTAGFLRPSTLILAAVIALEVAGVRALPQAEAGNYAVADGSAFAVAETADAPVRKHVASVEIRIVAQADTPAH